MRIGAKKRPFYRVVAVDERNKRTGGYIELLGTYNPLTEPKDIKLKKDRIDYWLNMGAQKSDGFLRILGEAPQRPPRKPKKEKKQESESQKSQDESRVEEAKVEEKPENVTTEEPKATEEKPVGEEKLKVESDQSDTPSPSESSEKKEPEK